MIKLIGNCLSCGAIHHKEVDYYNVNQWTEPVSVWCACGNEVHGIKWSVEVVNQEVSKCQR